MLYLLKEDKGPGIFYLISGKEYIVGRKNADIVINNDQSISRKHAVIKVEVTCVTLLDCESKYGTFHNSSKIPPNSAVSVRDKDIIKFGVFQSSYRIENISMITTGSGLTNEQKNELKVKTRLLGAGLCNNWDDTCTILTCQEIMLTIKVLNALVDDKPIVTLKYWNEFALNLETRKPPPIVGDFRPPVAECLINTVNLSPNPARKSLFKDKIFVFATEKVKNRMSDLITKTGGSSISWEKQPLTLLQVTKSKNNYLFIHSDEPNVIPQSLKEIHDHIIKLGERTIPMQEIAMAIVLCDCEKDCNPKFNRLHSVFIKKPAESLSEIFPLVFETPSAGDGSLDQNITKKELVIPESLDSDLQILVSPKPCSSSSSDPERPSSTSNPFVMPNNATSTKQKNKEPENNPSKRMRLDISEEMKSQISTNSKKRKADENSVPAPKKQSLMRENPFAILRNKSSRKSAPDNPFAHLRVKQESSFVGDNPFRRIIDNSNTDQGVIPVGQKSMEETAISCVSQNYCPTDTSNITWMSKVDSKEIKNEEIELDPDLKKIFDAFKNSVILEVLPMTQFKTQERNYINNDTGKKNFKKFKKVMPLNPHKTVISTSILQNSSKSNNDVSVISDDEEVEEIRQPVRKKPTTKRFDF